MEMISGGALNLIMILNLLNPGGPPPLPSAKEIPTTPPAVCTVEVACWEAHSQLKAILSPDLLSALQMMTPNTAQATYQNTNIPFAFVGLDGSLYTIHFGNQDEDGGLFSTLGVRGGRRPKCERTGTSCR